MNEIYLLCMHKECITGTQLEENEKTTRTTLHMEKKRSYLLYLDFSWVSWCTCAKVANGDVNIYFSKGMCNRTSITNVIDFYESQYLHFKQIVFCITF